MALQYVQQLACTTSRHALLLIWKQIAVILYTTKSSADIVCAEPLLIQMLLIISFMVNWQLTEYFINGIQILACWWPTGMLVTVQWSLAIQLVHWKPTESFKTYMLPTCMIIKIYMHTKSNNTTKSCYSNPNLKFKRKWNSNSWNW